jgi:hypothetical protein
MVSGSLLQYVDSDARPICMHVADNNDTIGRTLGIMGSHSIIDL